MAVASRRTARRTDAILAECCWCDGLGRTTFATATVALAARRPRRPRRHRPRCLSTFLHGQQHGGGISIIILVEYMSAWAPGTQVPDYLLTVDQGQLERIRAFIRPFYLNLYLTVSFL